MRLVQFEVARVWDAKSCASHVRLQVGQRPEDS